MSEKASSEVSELHQRDAKDLTREERELAAQLRRYEALARIVHDLVSAPLPRGLPGLTLMQHFFCKS